MSDHIDQRLLHLHTTMGERLDALLDLDAGLREAVTAEAHRRIGHTLDRLLDLNVGLRAIVPHAEPAAITPAPTAEPPQPGKLIGAAAILLMSQDIPTRLAIRHHPALNALALVFALVHGRVLSRILGRAVSRTVVDSTLRDLVRVLDHAQTRTRGLDLDLVGALDRACALARIRDTELDQAALARELDRKLVQARNLARARALALTRDLDADDDRDLVGALTRDLTRARTFDRDRTLGHTRDRARGGDRARARAVDRALDRDRARARAVDRDLDRALHDFTTADLHGVDLRQVRLDGLRWSPTTTRWPSEAWRAWALEDSAEVQPGIYEIRGGTAQVPQDILAP